MSTSNSSKKNRKDYNFASTVAASIGNINSETVSETEDRGDTVVTLPAMETKDEKASEFVEKPLNKEQIQQPETEVKPIPEIDFTENIPSPDDNIDKILSLSRNNHGVPKSVYLDEDIYLYIKEKSEKNNVKFSAVLNLLLRKYINSQK